MFVLDDIMYMPPAMFNFKTDWIFKDRAHAGKELAGHLEPRYKHLNPLVFGIPRGGVEVAYYVAKRLEAELHLIVAKKLGFPENPEYGFGALAEENCVYVSDRAANLLEPRVIDRIVKAQNEEIARRVETYRHGKPLPDMTNRTVILVDDGIATGVTLVPVLRLCKQRKAKQIVIAAPVSGKRYDPELNKADAVEILVQPANFHAVGQVYYTFGDFTDNELIALLNKAEKENKKHH
jgi:putative phosphoribosyl transferase